MVQGTQVTHVLHTKLGSFGWSVNCQHLVGGSTGFHKVASLTSLKYGLLKPELNAVYLITTLSSFSLLTYCSCF